jgi:two-component system, response regulator RegA
MSKRSPTVGTGANANGAGDPGAFDTNSKLGQESTDVFADYRRIRELIIMEPSVLIVDDEENLLILLDRILSKEGYQVKTANNANQALEYVEREPFRVAILDIKMYPIDGVALLAEIKKRSPNIRVIMITAYPTVDTRSDCMKYGASNYLTKPLDIQELKSVVHGLAAA